MTRQVLGFALLVASLLVLGVSAAKFDPSFLFETEAVGTGATETDACNAYDSCLKCTTQKGCGWCQARQVCLSGKANSSSDGTCTPSNGTWHYDVDECCGNNRTNCYDCTSLYYCGWCAAGSGESAYCFEKDGDGLPFNGTCVHKHWSLHRSDCDDDDDDGHEKKEVALIVGLSIAGALFAIATIATLVFIVFKRYQSKSHETYTAINE